MSTSATMGGVLEAGDAVTFVVVVAGVGVAVDGPELLDPGGVDMPDTSVGAALLAGLFVGDTAPLEPTEPEELDVQAATAPINIDATIARTMNFRIAGNLPGRTTRS